MPKHTVIALFLLAVTLVIAGCGAADNCEPVMEASITTPAEPPAPTAVEMLPAALDHPSVVFGWDHYHQCAEGTREVDIPSYMNGISINSTTAKIDTVRDYSMVSPGSSPRFDKMTVTFSGGPLPEIVGAYITNLDDYKDATGKNQIIKTTEPANWANGMEAAFFISGDNFMKDVSEVTLCVRT